MPLLSIIKDECYQCMHYVIVEEKFNNGSLQRSFECRSAIGCIYDESISWSSSEWHDG